VAGWGRRGVLIFGAAAVLAACASAESSSPPREKDAGESGVRTDAAPLERRFPVLGQLSDAHWLGATLGLESRMSVPGPFDVRVVGIARLRAGEGATIVEARQSDFRPETPGQVPGPLAGFLPDGATWVRSETFNREVTGEAYSGEFYLDPVSNSVYFDAINPARATDGSG
jgi:hypothetical protein